MPSFSPASRARMLAFALLGVASLTAPALATTDEGYQPGEAPVTTTWYALRSEAAMRADRAYVAGMRPHHAGALTMSADYLNEPGRASPLLQALARAIVTNQRFEIGVLDEVERNLAAPPWRLPFGATLQPVATEGLAASQRFFKAPIPAPPAHALGPVSEADVRFAKAMITHHEAALEMARAYGGDPAARNGFLGLLNVGIITDQSQEIALMRRVLAAFPGDPDRVEVPASMIHGMEGMSHGSHAARGQAAQPPASPGHAAPGHAAHESTDPGHGAHHRAAPDHAASGHAASGHAAHAHAAHGTRHRAARGQAAHGHGARGHAGQGAHDHAAHHHHGAQGRAAPPAARREPRPDPHAGHH